MIIAVLNIVVPAVIVAVILFNIYILYETL